MKKFKVTVNGKTYEVEVEEMGSAPAAPAAVSAPAAAPVPAAAPEPVKAAAPEPAAEAVPAAPKGPIPDNAVVVKAPMPGKISAVKQERGAVEHGAVIVVLEAMKMQNDITAPQDGTLTEVRVAVGDSVKTGDVLAVIMP